MKDIHVGQRVSGHELLGGDFLGSVVHVCGSVACVARDDGKTGKGCGAINCYMWRIDRKYNGEWGSDTYRGELKPAALPLDERIENNTL